MKPRYLIAAGIVLGLLVVSSRLGLWVVAAVGVPPVLLLNHLAGRDLRKKVETRCRELRELAFDALAAMVDAESDYARYVTIGPAVMGPCVGCIDVMLEHRSPETVRVAVRGSADVLFVTLVKYGGGFYKSRNGAMLPVADHEFDALV